MSLLSYSSENRYLVFLISVIVCCYDNLRIFIKFYFYHITNFISEFGDILPKFSNFVLESDTVVSLSNLIIFGEQYVLTYLYCIELDPDYERTAFCQHVLVKI